MLTYTPELHEADLDYIREWKRAQAAQRAARHARRLDCLTGIVVYPIAATALALIWVASLIAPKRVRIRDVDDASYYLKKG